MPQNTLNCTHNEGDFRSLYICHLKLIQMWRNSSFLHMFHVQKFEISPHDTFFSRPATNMRYAPATKKCGWQYLGNEKSCFCQNKRIMGTLSDFCPKNPKCCWQDDHFHHVVNVLANVIIIMFEFFHHHIHPHNRHI